MKTNTAFRIALTLMPVLITGSLLIACTKNTPPQTAPVQETDPAPAAAAPAEPAEVPEEEPEEEATPVWNINDTDHQMTHLPFTVEVIHEETPVEQPDPSEDEETAEETPDEARPQTVLTTYYHLLSENPSVQAYCDKALRTVRTQTDKTVPLTVRLLMQRADSRVFGFVQYVPGTDETEPLLFTHNLDPETGSEILLTDLADDTTALAKALAGVLIDTYVTNNPDPDADRYLPDEARLLQRIETLLAEAQKASGDAQQKGAGCAWSPVYYGVRFYFTKEALCESNAGVLSSVLQTVPESAPELFEVTVPYDANAYLFRAEYTLLPTEYIAPLPEGMTVTLSDGGRPVLLRASAERTWDETKGTRGAAAYSGAYTLDAGEGTSDFSAQGMGRFDKTGVRFYLVKTSENVFVYADFEESVPQAKESDILIVHLFEDGAFRFVGISDDMLLNELAPPLDPAHFLTERLYDFLPDESGRGFVHTHGVRICSAGPTGIPVSDDPYYAIFDPAEAVYTLHRDVTLDVLTSEDQTVPTPTPFPAGTVLSMFRFTMNVSADFRTQDGTVIRFYVNGVDGIDNIGGHEVRDVLYGDSQEEE
ncbi:MAG: hypothetical protein IJQ12_03825 [Lachnospiraceae bacterium]|nr:hypothetical protein [Lachnospiraceae bacterium]